MKTQILKKINSNIKNIKIEKTSNQITWDF